MIYRLTEATACTNGYTEHHISHFNSEKNALAGMKVIADNILDRYKKGLIKYSWLDLEIMYCNGSERFSDQYLEGEYFIDGSDESIALQYINAENFEKGYFRKGLND
jgi:hypothetical protein